MTTKEFIKMLQDADPTGEAHVRLPGGGVPFAAELKEGYWDGPYSYLENDIYVTTTKGFKVDVHVETPKDIVWDEKGNIDKLKTRFKFDYSYLIKEQNEERENCFWSYIEKEAKICRDFTEESLANWVVILKKLLDQKGIDEFHYYPNNYQWRGYSEGIEVHNEPLCGGEISAIIDSGLFELTLDSPDKKIYILK